MRVPRRQIHGTDGLHACCTATSIARQSGKPMRNLLTMDRIEQDMHTSATLIPMLHGRSTPLR